MAKKPPKKPKLTAGDDGLIRGGYVRNIDLPVGREPPPPGSMLKKPKGPKNDRS